MIRKIYIWDSKFFSSFLRGGDLPDRARYFPRVEIQSASSLSDGFASRLLAFSLSGLYFVLGLIFWTFLFALLYFFLVIYVPPNRYLNVLRLTLGIVLIFSVLYFSLKKAAHYFLGKYRSHRFGFLVFPEKLVLRTQPFFMIEVSRKSVQDLITSSHSSEIFFHLKDSSRVIALNLRDYEGLTIADLKSWLSV